VLQIWDLTNAQTGTTTEQYYNTLFPEKKNKAIETIDKITLVSDDMGNKQRG